MATDHVQHGRDVAHMIATGLRRHRDRHYHAFKGIVRISIPDMQALYDEMQRLLAIADKTKPRTRKMGHGDQVRYMGTRILADKHVALGGIEMEG